MRIWRRTPRAVLPLALMLGTGTAAALCFGTALAKEATSDAQNSVPVAAKKASLVHAETRAPSVLVSKPDELHPDEKMRSEEITGTISSVDNRGIAIEYGPSAEIYLTMSKAPKLHGFESLKELQIGDKVKVRYETVYKENQDGGKKESQTILKMRAIDISLYARGSLR